MTYANIILPLPLDGYFTYSVPDDLASRVQNGMRVTVPFGKSKTYVGIVAEYPVDVPKSAKEVAQQGKKKI